jgi:hypothetical protein
MPSWWDRYKQADEQRWVVMWERHRRLGFFGFVMVWGFGGLGLGTSAVGVCMCFGAVYFIHGREVGWDEMRTFPLPLLSGSIPIGMLTGVLLWFQNEQKYRRLMKSAGRELTPPGTGDPDAK